MEGNIPFTFRGKPYLCTAFIDSSEFPCFVFVLLDDLELVQEFGDEVTIKTDCEQVLVREDDYPALFELRNALFTAIKSAPECVSARRKMTLLDQAPKNNFLQNAPLFNGSQQIKPF